MMQTLTRRRFIGISGAAAGLALLPLHGRASAGSTAVVWRGRALGAPAELALNHPDRALAEELVRRAASEIARLEQVFSLYAPDSALSRLNSQAALAVPPSELVALLETSRAVWELSEGAFDPTVQPLWLLHARHFSAPGASPAGPPRAEVEKVRKLVGFDGVAFDRSRIAFARRGMALTLNGIAQGYITDRIVGMLRAGGVTSTLVDAGEIGALGTNIDGRPWRVGIAAPEGGDAPLVLDLADRALATSSVNGFRFAGPGSTSHLIDPRGKDAAVPYASVSVLASSATIADALSTAFSFMDTRQISRLLASFPDVEVYLRAQDGRLLHLS